MADNPLNSQVWPNLPETVDPAVATHLKLLYNIVKNHRDAFAALKDQQTAASTTQTTVVNQGGGPGGGFTAGGDLRGTSTSQRVVGLLNTAFDFTTWADGMFPQFQATTGMLEGVWVYQKMQGGVLGIPTSGQPLLWSPVVQPITFAANLAASVGNIDPQVGANPAATVTLPVKRWTLGVGTQIGTISVSTGGVVTFTTTGGTTQSAGTGDLIAVYNQSPADVSMAYLTFTLAAFLGSTAPTLPSMLAGSVMWPGAFTGNDIMLGDPDGIHAKDSNVQISADGTMAANSDSLVPTQKSVVTYVGSHAMVLLEEHTASNVAELDFTTAITAAYDDYVIRVVNIVAQSGTPGLLFQVFSSGAYDVTNAHYVNMLFFNRLDNTSNGQQNPNAAGLQFGGSNAAKPGINGYLNLYNPGEATASKLIDGTLVMLNADGNYYREYFGTRYTQTTAITGFRFKFDSGNIGSGTIRVYGMAK